MFLQHLTQHLMTITCIWNLILWHCAQSLKHHQQKVCPTMLDLFLFCFFPSLFFFLSQWDHQSFLFLYSGDFKDQLHPTQANYSRLLDRERFRYRSHPTLGGIAFPEEHGPTEALLHFFFFSGGKSFDQWFQRLPLQFSWGSRRAAGFFFSAALMIIQVPGIISRYGFIQGYSNIANTYTGLSGFYTARRLKTKYCAGGNTEPRRGESYFQDILSLQD